MLRFFVFALSAAAFAQTPETSIAVTVSRTLSVTAELAVLELRANTAASTTLAQVLEALSPLALKEEHLTGVSAGGFLVSGPVQIQGQRGDITYSFRMTAAAATFRELVGKLDESRQQVGGAIRQIDYAVILSASAKTLDEARQAALPELFAEARGRAESLARAAGVRLGAVISATETSSDSFVGVQGAQGSQITLSLAVRFARQ
ncbi:MAG: SIMPL domain-containing protein [Bryobacteraceae bacterium]|nr:SIMPL domain-containing protein [Bryobacteraceae bacterium]